MSRSHTDRAVVRKRIQNGERAVFAIRRHPIVLTVPIANVMGGSAAAIGANIISNNKLIIAITWLLVGLFICAQVLFFINWYSDFFVATSKRLIISTSPIGRKFPTTSLKKVSNIEMRRSWRGYLIGYGSLSLRTSGDDFSIDYIPYPESLYRELSKLIEDRWDE